MTLLYRSSMVTLLLFLVLVAGRSAAQEPTVSPSDPAARQAKPEPAEPLLELPEVLIIGQDSYHRLAKDKKSLTPETPQVVPLPNVYEAAAVSPEKRLAVTDFITPKTYVLLQGGSSLFFNGMAGHHLAFDRGQIIGTAYLNRSDGQYRNSRTIAGGIRLKADYTLNEKTTLLGTASYERFGYGLQSAGYRRNDAERSGGEGKFHTSVNYLATRSLSGKASVEFGITSLQNDTADVKVDRSSDFYYRVEAGAQYRLGRLRLGAKAGFLRESFSFAKHEQTLDLGDLSLTALMPFGRAVTATVGAEAATFAADSASGSRISPLAALVFAPSERFAAVIKLNGGITPFMFADYRQENRFIAHSMPLRPQEDKLRLKLEWEFAVSNALTLQGGFHRRWAASMPFAQPDTLSGLFGLGRLENAEITETRLGLRVKLGRNAEAGLAFIDNSDDLGGESATGLSVPYLPDYRLPLDAAVGFPHGFRLNASAELLGRRRLALVSRVNLPARFRMNLRLSRSFGSSAEAFIDFYNLFNDRSFQWEGYRETGLIASLGIIYRR